jgi:hypothetical protein
MPQFQLKMPARAVCGLAAWCSVGKRKKAEGARRKAEGGRRKKAQSCRHGEPVLHRAAAAQAGESGSGSGSLSRLRRPSAFRTWSRALRACSARALFRFPPQRGNTHCLLLGSAHGAGTCAMGAQMGRGRAAAAAGGSGGCPIGPRRVCERGGCVGAPPPTVTRPLLSARYPLPGGNRWAGRAGAACCWWCAVRFVRGQRREATQGTTLQRAASRWALVGASQSQSLLHVVVQTQYTIHARHIYNRPTSM